MGRKSLAAGFGIFGMVILYTLLRLSLATVQSPESAGDYIYLFPWAHRALWFIFGPALGISMAATVSMGFVAQYFNLNQYEFFFGAVDILLIYGTIFVSLFTAAFLEFAVVGYFVRFVYDRAINARV